MRRGSDEAGLLPRGGLPGRVGVAGRGREVGRAAGSWSGPACGGLSAGIRMVIAPKVFPKVGFVKDRIDKIQEILVGLLF